MVMTRNLDGATIGKFSRSLVIFFFSQLNVLLDINLIDITLFSFFLKSLEHPGFWVLAIESGKY